MWWGHHGGHSFNPLLTQQWCLRPKQYWCAQPVSPFLASFLKNCFCRTFLHKQCWVQPVFPFLASIHKNLRICTNCVQCHKNSKLAASLCVKLTHCFINSIYCFKSFQKDIYQRKTSANLIKEIATGKSWENLKSRLWTAQKVPLCSKWKCYASKIFGQICLILYFSWNLRLLPCSHNIRDWLNDDDDGDELRHSLQIPLLTSDRIWQNRKVFAASTITLLRHQIQLAIKPPFIQRSLRINLSLEEFKTIPNFTKNQFEIEKFPKLMGKAVIHNPNQPRSHFPRSIS